VHRLSPDGDVDKRERVWLLRSARPNHGLGSVEISVYYVNMFFCTSNQEIRLQVFVCYLILLNLRMSFRLEFRKKYPFGTGNIHNVDNED
jgi:hypothetical protein